jgi:cleavage and polyadenylation specificity factor subunit 3
MDYFDDNNPSVVMASPGMLQNGQSRDLFERWCHDPQNGLVLTGYCVENTLAKDVLSKPWDITLTDGSTKPLRMSVNYISFSAHADYQQTSNFIEQLKPSYVVLVHGDSNEMGRLKNALERKFTMKVLTPVNHQTVEFVFPIKVNAKIVKEEDEYPSEGVIVRKEPENIIMPVETLLDYTSISVNRILQKLHVPYNHSLRLLQYLVKCLFPEVKSKQEDSRVILVVSDSVKVIPEYEGSILLEWQASPQNDIIADAIALTILQVRSNPSPALLQAMNEMELEDRKFRFTVALLEKRFSNVIAEIEMRRIKVIKGEHFVSLDFDHQEYEGNNDTLLECIRGIVESVLAN